MGLAALGLLHLVLPGLLGQGSLLAALVPLPRFQARMAQHHQHLLYRVHRVVALAVGALLQTLCLPVVLAVSGTSLVRALWQLQ